MSYATERKRLAVVERVQNIKRALKQGVTVETRTNARSAKHLRWCDFFERQADQGYELAAILPAAFAEAEERIADEVCAAIKALKVEQAAEYETKLKAESKRLRIEFQARLQAELHKAMEYR